MISFSIWSLTLNIILLAVGYVILKVIVSPYLRLQYYRSQGIETSFVPLLGYFKAGFANVQKHGDFYYEWKQRPYQKVRSKNFAVNTGNIPGLWLVEPDLIKTFFNNQDPYSRKPEILVFIMELVGDAMVFLNGSDMKRHRKLASSAFNYEFLKKTIRTCP